MPNQILVPSLGESITEATVSKWFKQVGESVDSDEPLVELETDKVNVEVPSPLSGTLTSIKVSKYPSGSDNTVVEYLQSIVNNDVVLTDVSNINNFGVYTVNSVNQDSSATDYYDIALTAKVSNGTLVDEKFYSIILYAGLSGDKSYVHTQSASSASWTINHGLGKKPSVTITTLATGVQVIGEVTYTNDNTLVCSFATAVSGIANLN